MFRVTNIRKSSRSGIRTHHTGQTPPTLRDGNSCSQNSRNDISDVTFNYFYSDSRKVPRIRADVLTPVNSTLYDSWCTTSDFFVALVLGASSWGQAQTKISYHRWSRYRSCGKRVTNSPQAVIYLFSPLRSNRLIPCVQCKRATLPILNQCRVHMPQTFLLLPIFRSVLVER